MYLVHSFRLRDPWQIACDAEVVCWTRTFHRPTGLEPGDALWLVVSGLPTDSTVSLNGRLLESRVDQCGQFDVTGQIGATNRIAIRLPRQSAPSSVDGKFPLDVRLGIVGT